MRTLPFTKMHGAGNDYVYVDAFDADVAARLDALDVPELARRVSNRNFGVGSDGLIVLARPTRAGAACAMRMWNADGSRGQMCGNGLRCLAKLAHDRGRVAGDELVVETDSGARRVSLVREGGRIALVRADMGSVEVQLSPLRIVAAARPIDLFLARTGNPHAVTFVPDVEKAPVMEVGAALQSHEAFPDGVNVEFVQVLGPDTLAQRTFERGSGETLACGTGACAAAVVALTTGKATGASVRVRLRGGDLTITRNGDSVELEGPAVTVFEGELDLVALGVAV